MVFASAGAMEAFEACVAETSKAVHAQAKGTRPASRRWVAGRGGADGGAGWGHWSRGMASSWTGDDGIGRPSRRQAGSREKGRDRASCPCPPAPEQATGSGALMPLRRME